MQPLGIIIFCLAVVPPFLCNGEENAEVDPIFEYLQMRTKDVIEHELVHINTSQHMQKRALFGDFPDRQGTEMRFRAFGGDINLWLYPRDSLLASTETPVYFAYKDSSMSGGVRYELQRDAMKKVGRIFEDSQNHATVYVNRDPLHDHPTYTGYMRYRRDNTALVIRPLPQKVVERHLKRRRSIDGSKLDSSLESARHVVLKVKNFFPKFDLDQGLQKVNARGNTSRSSRSYAVDNIDYSHSIYPKNFVQLDSTYWSQESSSSKDDESAMTTLLQYVLAFWNGVDLSYRHLENPNIRFHISGIAIARDPKATPFIYTSQQSEYSPIDAAAAADKEKIFFFAVRNQISLDTYNIAATMTQLKLDGGTTGMAAVGAICLDPYRTKEAVLLVHDSGAFDGIDIAVHEVGHSFGLSHDDGKKSAKCDKSYGYIMASSAQPTENAATFSPCSLAKFNELLRQGSLQCLSTPPLSKLNDLPKLLPGKVLSLNEQCQKLGFMKRCGFSSEGDPCVRMSCTSKLKGRRERCQRLAHGAAPGTPCGDANDQTPRYCIQRRCVALN